MGQVGLFHRTSSGAISDPVAYKSFLIDETTGAILVWTGGAWVSVPAMSALTAGAGTLAGSLSRVTDGKRGLWMGRGAQALPVLPEVDVADAATGGTGTELDPWTGWDTALTWAGGYTYRFRDGYFQYSASWSTAAAGTILQGAGCDPGGTGGTVLVASGLANNTNALQIKHRRCFVRDLQLQFTGGTGGTGILFASGVDGTGLINVGAENVYVAMDRGTTNTTGVKVGNTTNQWVTLASLRHVQASGAAVDIHIYGSQAVLEICYADLATLSHFKIEGSQVNALYCYAESSVSPSDACGFDLDHASFSRFTVCQGEKLQKSMFRIHNASYHNTFDECMSLGNNQSADATIASGWEFVSDTEVNWANTIINPRDTGGHANSVASLHFGANAVRNVIVNRNSVYCDQGVSYDSAGLESSQIEIGGYYGIGAEWTNHPVVSTDYTGDGAMTWIVSPDAATVAYQRVGKTMTLSFRIPGTTVGGTPSNKLKALIPGGFSAAKESGQTIMAKDNGVWDVGQVTVVAGDPNLYFWKDAIGGNWSASSENTDIFGAFVFEVQ